MKHQKESGRSPTLKETSALLAIGTRPLVPAIAVSFGSLIEQPQYSSTAYKVHQRRGYQTFFHHTVSWPMSHWWDLQDWLNQTQYALEQIYGPIVHLVGTQPQTHNDKPLLLGFYEIGPVFPDINHVRVGSEWRKFLAAISDDD